jgi:MFS family permease
MEPEFSKSSKEPLVGSQPKREVPSHENEWGWRVIFLVNVFLACVSFSIVLPSLWPYLETFKQNENFLASVLAMYSIGEFIGSVIWGYVFDKASMRTSLWTCIVTGFVGSLLYALGMYFSFGHWLVLAGRFIQGLWTGGQ